MAGIMGSKLLFLTPAGEGMFSTIAKKIPSEFMSFKHIGVVKDGKEQPQDDKTKDWSGAMENYLLSEYNGITELKVGVEIVEEYESYFLEKFPKALDNLRVLAES